MSSEVNVKEQRWNNIDLLEFLGVAFVIMYHLPIYGFDFLAKPAAINYVRYFLRTILPTCVPLFFFANGYLLLNRKFDLKKHIIKSIRIVVLTFIWAAIIVLSLMLIKNEQLSASEFLNYILEWQYGWTNHLWYMGALIIIYVFFPLIKVAYDNNRKVFYFFTIVVACFTFGNTFINHVVTIISGVTGKENTIYNSNWFNMFQPFKGLYGYSFVYFCVGGLAFELKQQIEKIDAVKRNILAAGTIVLSCLLLFLEGLYFSFLSGAVWEVVWFGYDSVFTFINVCAIFVLSLSYKKGIKIVQLVSCNSLGIYYIHIIFVHVLAPKVIMVPLMCSFAGGVIVAALIIAISLIVALIIKKIPVVKLLLKI